MPRIARLQAPHAFHHITANVASGEFRLDQEIAKNGYLRRLRACVRRGDYRLLSYALMGNHVHFGLEVLKDPVCRLMQSLQGAYAAWLNKLQGRSGHLWRGRYHEVVGDDAAFAVHMITYHHNNPVRSGLVEAAADSEWSSHRAYCSPALRFSELDVARGLELCGVNDTPRGRDDFDQITFGRLLVGRCEWMSEEWLARVRARTREIVGWPVEIGQPVVSVEDTGATEKQLQLVVSAPVVVAAPTASAHRLLPHVDDVIRVVAARFDTDDREIRGRGGGRRSQLFRRVVIWMWVRGLGGRPIDVARALNRSDAAVSQILGRMQLVAANDEARRIADELARALATGDESNFR